MFTPNALLHSIEGGVLIGIKCKIRSRLFILSPFVLIERIKIQILCLFHKKIFFYPKKLWKLLFKTLIEFFCYFGSFITKTYFTNKILLLFLIFWDQFFESISICQDIVKQTPILLQLKKWKLIMQIIERKGNSYSTDSSIHFTMDSKDCLYRPN